MSSMVFALPSGYVGLEYIAKNNSSQYIQTDYVGNLNSRYEGAVFITNSLDAYYIASREDYGLTRNIAIAGSENGFYTGYGQYQQSDKCGIALNGRRDFVTDYLNGVYSIAGTDGVCEKQISSAAMVASFINTAPLQIFFNRTAGSSGTATYAAPTGTRIYYLKIYENNNLVHHFIPAKRSSDNVVGMYDIVENEFLTNAIANTGSFTAGPVSEIKIATTKFVDEEFKAAEAKLATTVETIEDVVSRTITQTGQIATLQEEKQTRPDETCPAGKKCLLVMDENDIPHWYEIIEAAYDFVANWFTPFNDAGRPGAWIKTSSRTNPTSGATETVYEEYNGFYNGAGTWRQTYVDSSTSVYRRPFDSVTRCLPNATRDTGTLNAGLCYPETGVFKTLAEGEWALVYNGSEGSSTKKVPASVVYGTSKCTTVAGPNNYATSNPTKFSELTPAQQAAWGVEPNSTNKSANAAYKQCWCKMTALGIPNSGETIASGQSTAGTIYPLPESSSAWVFDSAGSSAADCASRCAAFCPRSVRDNAGFCAAVLSWQ